MKRVDEDLLRSLRGKKKPRPDLDAVLELHEREALEANR
jgi:hypothetical protein